jgi:outer membrane protein, multidrug efflux system
MSTSNLKLTSLIFICLLLVGSLLGGCSTYDLFKHKNKPQPASDAPLTPPSWQATLPHDGKVADLADWWQQFNDPVLTQLIQSAQLVNPDIATAKANIAAAQAAVTAANAQLLPNVTAGASASRSRSGTALPSSSGVVFPTSSTAGISADMKWELDVWGKNQADKNEEEAKLTGTKALWHEARVIVAADTAKQYINYRLCENLEKIANKNVESSSETARLSGLTAQAGFLAPASASQAEAQAAEAINRLKKQQLQCVLIVKSLVALTAIPEPDLQASLDKNSGVVPTPVNIEVDAVPAKTLSQRPDVLNAERNVAATSFEIIVNEAQRYPSLSLSGNIGLSYDSAAHKLITNRRSFFKDGFTWSIGPLAVSIPIYDAGVSKANIKAAKAQYEAAKIIYESVARNAVREVEDALVKLNSTALRLDDVKKAADGFNVSLAATQTRYQANLANLFELEEARRASLQADTNVFTLENERILAWIDLYRAMGGGWTAARNTLPNDTPALIFEHAMNHDINDVEVNPIDMKNPDANP